MLREMRGFAEKALAKGAMPRTKRRMGLVFIMLVTVLAVLSTPLPVQAQNARGWKNEGDPVRHVVVTVYKSKTFHLDQPFSTAVVGSPDIVDALPMSDRSLYVQGKKVGTTNVSVFDSMMRLMGVLDVEVTLDTGSLQDKIRQSTGSRSIRVSSSDGQIVLMGEASNAVQAERAVSIAPSQQVLLKVRFLEASRDAGRALGVNWFAANRSGTRVVNTGQGGLVPPANNTNPNTTPSGVPLLQT